MKTGTIYRIYHINSGKSYIGQTVQPIENYIKRKLNTHTGCTKLNDAIKKHGKESFKWEILHVNVHLDMLDNLERQHIRIWRCLTNGYNLDSGGNTQKQRSSETKKRISVSLSGENAPHWGKKNPDFAERSRQQTGENHPMWGKKNPGASEYNRRRKGENNPMWGKKRPEHSKRMSGENHPLYGKTPSAQTKQKISRANKGKLAGEKHPMYGKKRPDTSERNRKNNPSSHKSRR